MRNLGFGFAVFLGLAMSASAAGADSIDVEELTYSCIGCHGENGEGIEELGAPRLAGQGVDYLSEQTLHFSNGRRGSATYDVRGTEMRVSVEGMPADEITALSTYFANLETPLMEVPSLPGDLVAGKQLYDGSCASCHGYKAGGSPAVQAPNLIILAPWYIKDQMAAYQKGWRGGEGSSTRAKFMRSIARQVTAPEQLDGLAAYIMSLRSES